MQTQLRTHHSLDKGTIHNQDKEEKKNDRCTIQTDLNHINNFFQIPFKGKSSVNLGLSIKEKER